MTVLSDVENLIIARSPGALCDDCIKEVLGLSVRQHANHKTRELEKSPKFMREYGLCSRCSKTKLVISSVVKPDTERTDEVTSDDFDRAMFRIYERARDEAGYTARVYLQMLSDLGGLQTARKLINSEKTSQGYTALYERGRLDLTVEAMIIENPKWQALFTPDELERVRNQLKRHHYKVAD